MRMLMFDLACYADHMKLDRYVAELMRRWAEKVTPAALMLAVDVLVSAARYVLSVDHAIIC